MTSVYPVGLSGQMIKIASGVSCGWTRVMINRSALVTGPADSSMGDDVATVTSQVIEVPGSDANATRDRLRGRKPGSTNHRLGTCGAVLAT